MRQLEVRLWVCSCRLCSKSLQSKALGEHHNPDWLGLAY